MKHEKARRRERTNTRSRILPKPDPAKRLRLRVDIDCVGRVPSRGHSCTTLGRRTREVDCTSVREGIEEPSGCPIVVKGRLSSIRRRCNIESHPLSSKPRDNKPIEAQSTTCDGITEGDRNKLTHQAESMPLAIKVNIGAGASISQANPFAGEDRLELREVHPIRCADRLAQCRIIDDGPVITWIGIVPTDEDAKLSITELFLSEVTYIDGASPCDLPVFP